MSDVHYCGYLAEVLRKETRGMRPREVIFITLFLAVLWLGNSSSALASSVTGSGTSGNPNDNFQRLTISARSGPNGTAGIVQVMRERTDEKNSAVGTVIDLCVEDNEAIVVAQSTRGNIVNPGDYMYILVRDNGSRGDEVAFYGFELLIPCEEVTFFVTDTLTVGNINVTP
jgi:hypothetical protein